MKGGEGGGLGAMGAAEEEVGVEDGAFVSRESGEK